MDHGNEILEQCLLFADGLSGLSLINDLKRWLFFPCVFIIGLFAIVIVLVTHKRTKD